MPPQQRLPPPPPSSNARKVDAEASKGLRTLALQFEATGKWAQVSETKAFTSSDGGGNHASRRRSLTPLPLFSLSRPLLSPLSRPLLSPLSSHHPQPTQAIKCYDACLAIAADEPRVEASVRLACARLLLRHTANAADARQQLERARLLLNTVKDGGGGAWAGMTPAGSSSSSSFSVTSLRCAVFSELASVHASLGSARAAADALARGSAAAAASGPVSSPAAAAWQAHFATRAAALSSPLHGGILSAAASGSASSPFSAAQRDPLEDLSSWLPSAPPLAAAAVALARGATAANEPGRAEEEAVEFVQKALRLLQEVELEAKREREEEERAAASKEEEEGEEEEEGYKDVVIVSDDDGSGCGGDGTQQQQQQQQRPPKRRKSSAGDAVRVAASSNLQQSKHSSPFPPSVYPSRATELAHAARLRAHAEALRVALSLSAGDPVADLGIQDKGRCMRLADSLSAAVGALVAARAVREAAEGEVAAAVAAAAAGSGSGRGGGGGGGGAGAGAGARRGREGGDPGAAAAAAAAPALPPPLPSPPSLTEDAEAAASAAGALATAAGVLRPLCKFIYAAVHLARGLEICDEGLAGLGAVGGFGRGGGDDTGDGNNNNSSSTLESSLPPHVSAAAAPLIRARLTLLDARARCWLSQSDLAQARRDVASALSLAGQWPRAAAPLLAPLLLPLAGSYCLCARELSAARAFLGAAAAASGPRAYQLQAQRQQQQQQRQLQASATTTPEHRGQSSSASAPPSSSVVIVQPPAGPAVPAANAAFAAAHAAFAELADPSPAGGGPAARATSVLKAGLAFPAALPAGPGVPRTHRATAQLALGCTLAASAAAAAGEGNPAAAQAAAEARARARTCFGSAMAAAQRNLSNLQLTAFALGAMAPLLAYDDGKSNTGGGGETGRGVNASSFHEASVEAGRTLFIGALDVAKQIDCPAAVLAATCGWVQQSGDGGEGGEAAAASDAYIARYEARRAARVAEAKGLAPVPGAPAQDSTAEALVAARAEHEAIVGWMPVCQ